MSWRRSGSPQLILGYRRPLPRVLSRLAQPEALLGDAIHQHMHVIGLTGQGKSKFLASKFIQLHTQGIACGVIDPHSDLARDCLQLALDQGVLDDETGRRRLLYIDFSRRDAYLPFNWLRQPADSHTIARRLVEVCTRAWPTLADGNAPTFENILLHATVVLVENGYPLTLLSRLLVDKTFRDMSLIKVYDQQVQTFFHDRYDRWGREGVLMRESTLNRIALLTFSPALRYSLGQHDNALDFRAHLDQGISVVYNLGGLDEEAQRFLGALLLVGYETAALTRAGLPIEARRPWHLIVDEFSLFSPRSEATFTQILSTARKFGLFFTLAHQTWSQVSARLQGALQHTTSIAFKLGRSDAEWAARQFGRFDESAIRHEVADPRAVERTHPVYWGLAETFERWTRALEDLQPREAYSKHAGQAVKIRTADVLAAITDPQHLDAVISTYRHLLLHPDHEVKERVDATLSIGTTVHAVHSRRIAL